MLCLASWSGVVPTFKDNSLRLFCKLGGQLLGYLHIDFKLPTFEKLLNLQLQASKLMKHPTRFARDILFWQDANILTDVKFVCLDHMDEHESKHAEQLLERAMQSSLSMTYNEDDSWAQSCCTEAGLIQPWKWNPHEVYIAVHRANVGELGRRLLHLEYEGITSWVFSSWVAIEELVPYLVFLRHTMWCMSVRILAYPQYVTCYHVPIREVSYEGEGLAKFLASLKN